MNVYPCWYNGNFGYGCRTRGRSWMFVPDLGQPDNRIYKKLALDALLFENPFDRQLELQLANRTRKFSITGFLHALIFPGQKPRTVGGLLFTVS